MRKVAFLVVGAVMLAGCKAPGPPQGPPGGAAKPDLAEASQFQALPAVMEAASHPRTPEKVALGRMLYYDTRFSSEGTISCYVCHPLHDYGQDHRVKGVGVGHQQGDRNDPTVFNAAGQLAQFWDGRAADVETQAMGPPLNPIEMGMKDGAAIIAVIRSIPGYQEAFRQAFPAETDPVTFENFGRAIGAFERGLTTPAPFDRYLGHLEPFRRRAGLLYAAFLNTDTRLTRRQQCWIRSYCVEDSYSPPIHPGPEKGWQFDGDGHYIVCPHPVNDPPEWWSREDW